VTTCNLISSKRWLASLSSALGVAQSTWTAAMGVRKPIASLFVNKAHWPLESTKGLGALTLQVALATSHSSASSRSNLIGLDLAIETFSSGLANMHS
jgi:hypothetical protein